MQYPDRCRGCIELCDLMILYHFPCTSGIRIGRYTFEHDSGRTCSKRSVDDIGMSRDPSDICRTPVDIILFDIKDPLHGHLCPENISCCAMLHSFWFSCTSRCIEQKERIFTVHQFKRTLCILRLDHDIVIMVSSFDPLDLLIVSFDDQYRFYTLATLGKCIVHNVFEHVRFSFSVGTICSDHQFSLSIFNTVFQCFSRESSKDNGVYRSDPGTGKHRIRSLRDHRHIEDNSVSFHNAKLISKQICHFIDMQ